MIDGETGKEQRRGYIVPTLLWSRVFSNHNFAPENSTQNHQYTNHYEALRHRLELFARLAGKRRRGSSNTTKKKKANNNKQCFSLPNRYFNFVPVVPPDMMNYPPASLNGGNDVEGGADFDFREADGDDEFDDDDDDNIIMEDDNHMYIDNNDPPPVEFTCDSFTLTSHATGTEYVILNPYSGSIEVHASILDNALGSEENLLELAMYDASEHILRKRRDNTTRRSLLVSSSLHTGEMHDFEDERSEDIAGEAIHQRYIQQPKMYDTPPSQVLFSVQDYFDLDLEDYFGPRTPFASSRKGNVTVDWVGVDTHVAMSDDGKSVNGNWIGAARILTMESERRDEEELHCTEVLAWSNVGNVDARYGSKFVCRVAASFYFLDICAKSGTLYAAFQLGSGVIEGGNLDSMSHGGANNENRHRDLMDIDDESIVNDDGEPIRMSRVVHRFPLVGCNGQSECLDSIGAYFPSPEASIVAQYPVSCFSVDKSGQFLIVGTVHGTVEMWHTGVHSSNSNCSESPRRLEILSVRESFLKRARSMTIGARCRIDLECDAKPVESEEHETQDDLALVGDSGDNELPHKNPTCKISQIILPHHLPVQRGFITKQRDSESGTTLLLWQPRKISTEEDASDLTNHQFQIVSMINLPLSSQSHPEIHFDGRRLIVFGQDHIGPIILIYHVLGTRYDQDAFSDEANTTPAEKSNGKGNQESGGVINLLDEHRIKFVNRIRHAGLGGLEYFDSLIMSANERFIVVNTKCGNLIASDGTRNASQGLLVIDLKEYGGSD